MVLSDMEQRVPNADPCPPNLKNFMNIKLNVMFNKEDILRK